MKNKNKKLFNQTSIWYLFVTGSIVLSTLYLYFIIRFWLSPFDKNDGCFSNYSLLIISYPLSYIVLSLWKKETILGSPIAIIYSLVLLVIINITIVYDIGYGPTISIRNLPIYIVGIINILFGVYVILNSKYKISLIVFSIIKIIEGVLFLSIFGIIIIPFIWTIDLIILFILTSKNLLTEKNH